MLYCVALWVDHLNYHLLHINCGICYGQCHQIQPKTQNYGLPTYTANLSLSAFRVYSGLQAEFKADFHMQENTERLPG